ncbi:MAG: hypothetical protein ACI8PB_000958 [Desulforhopalus sp.]|jgi:hypothetical protein
MISNGSIFVVSDFAPCWQVLLFDSMLHIQMREPPHGLCLATLSKYCEFSQQKHRITSHKKKALKVDFYSRGSVNIHNDLHYLQFSFIDDTVAFSIKTL